MMAHDDEIERKMRHIIGTTMYYAWWYWQTEVHESYGMVISVVWYNSKYYDLKYKEKRPNDWATLYAVKYASQIMRKS